MTIRVNGLEIPHADILAEMQYHPAPNRVAAEAMAAEALVVRGLLRQRAAMKGLLDPASRDMAEEENAIETLISEEVSSPKAGEAVARRWYETHLTDYRTPVLFEASHILFAAFAKDGQKSIEAKALATAALVELERDPMQFEAIARAQSACSSGAAGGNLGQIAPGEIAPELESFLLVLEEGQISPLPIQTEFGFHILRLNRRIEPRQIAFEDAAAMIVRMLERRSRNRAVAQYISLLAGDSQIDGIDLKCAASPLLQ
jgi:peptidyl-prolyl cis-trans isomerase C